MVRSHSSQGAQGSKAPHSRTGTVAQAQIPALAHVREVSHYPHRDLRFPIWKWRGVLAHASLFPPKAVGQGPVPRVWIPRTPGAEASGGQGPGSPLLSPPEPSFPAPSYTGVRGAFFLSVRQLPPGTHTQIFI